MTPQAIAPMCKKDFLKVMFIALLQLPFVVHVYGAFVSLTFVFMSEALWLKVLGVVGSAITAGLAALRYYRDHRNERKFLRAEEKLEAAEKKLEALEEENERLRKREIEFQNERNTYRQGLEARLREVEGKVEQK